MRIDSKHLASWALVLCVFWLLLSGFFQPLLLGLSLASVMLVVIIIARMDRIDEEIKSVHYNPRLGIYFIWLLWQIAVSSIQVARIIWKRDLTLTPSIDKIPCGNTPSQSQALYANSITLTPGTLSIDIEDNEITVHALNAGSLDELKSGYMEKRISGITN